MSFLESLSKDIQQKADEAVKAAFEARISTLAKELKVEEKEIRRVLDLPLKKNSAVIIPKQNEERKEVKKLPIFPDFDDEILYVVKDYTDKSYTIFGKTVTKAIKTKILEPMQMKFQENLAYGAGWVGQATKYAEFIKKLEKMDIDYTVMSRKEMEDFAQKIKDGDDDEDLAKPAAALKVPENNVSPGNRDKKKPVPKKNQKVDDTDSSSD
jgi:hypothetical protein